MAGDSDTMATTTMAITHTTAGTTAGTILITIHIIHTTIHGLGTVLTIAAITVLGTGTAAGDAQTVTIMVLTTAIIMAITMVTIMVITKA